MLRCPTPESCALAALVALGCATSRYDGEPVEPLEPDDGGTSLIGLGALSPSCGADGGSGEATCSACLTAQCGAEYGACFGPEFQVQIAGGVCTELAGCSIACACGDSTCFQTCLSDTPSDVECRTCLDALTACSASRCAAACAGSSTPDGGSGADGGLPEEAGTGGGSDAGAGPQRGG